jgi:two-component system, NarL family, sensor histidine kinase DesK
VYAPVTMSRAGLLGRLFAIGLLLLMTLPMGVFVHVALPMPRLAAAASSAALLVLLYIWFWVRWPQSGTLRATAVTALALTVAGLAFNFSSGVATVNPLIFPIVVTGFALPIRAGIAAVVSLTAVALAAVLLSGSLAALSEAEILVLLALVGAELLLIGGGAIGVAGLLATLRELREARETIARMAVADERDRFARDLHDLLGHSLSLITLKGELAGQLLESRPEQAAAELRDLVGVAREALRDVRETIGGYRQPTLATELAAARAALAAGGIELGVDERVGALTGPVEAALAWTVREGVTNVVRHSGARRCTVLLWRDAGCIVAEVSDDGPGGPPAAVGNGLRGVRERAEALSGQLIAERLPGRGFRLRVTIPAHLPETSTEGSEAGRTGLASPAGPSRARR